MYSELRTELTSLVLVELLITLYLLGAVSLLDGIMFSLYKLSFLSPELGFFEVFEVEGRRNPDSIKIKTNTDKFSMFDGIYQKVKGEYYSRNPVWRHSNGTSQWIFCSEGGRWCSLGGVGSRLV